MKKNNSATLIQSVVRMHQAKTNYHNTQKKIIKIQTAIRKMLGNNMYAQAIDLLKRYADTAEKDIPEDNFDNTKQAAEYKKIIADIKMIEQKIKEISSTYLQLANNHTLTEDSAYQMIVAVLSKHTNVQLSEIQKLTPKIIKIYTTVTLHGLPCYLRSMINGATANIPTTAVTTWTQNLASNLTRPDPKQTLFCPQNEKTQGLLTQQLSQKTTSNDAHNIQQLLRLFNLENNPEDAGNARATFEINLNTLNAC